MKNFLLLVLGLVFISPLAADSCGSAKATKCECGEECKCEENKEKCTCGEDCDCEHSHEKQEKSDE